MTHGTSRIGRLLRTGIAGCSAAAAFAAAAPAHASVEATSVLPISLAEGSFAGLPAGGQSRFQYVDSGLAEVGDVNGDGLADVAIGAASADPLGRRDAGVVHVVFGGSPLGRIDLRSQGPAGFEVIGPRQGRRRPAPVFEPDGPPAGAMAGSSVAGAGDVNGDGLDDIVVGAPYAGNRGRSFSGSVYVVFGKRSGEPVELARLGSAGYRIDGPRADAAAGYAVAGPGDVNGDGRADVVVSAGIVQRATVYVVLGQAGSEAVDLRRLAGRGFAIRGGGRRGVGDAGAAVSGAGDFNADGFADIAVGAPQSGIPRREGAGVTFVIFGGPASGSVALGELNGRGVRIDGEHEFSNLGESLAPLGDVSGDGRGDLLIGASQVSAPGRRYAGAAYVVFGRAAGSLDLRRPGAAAYRILGPGPTGAGGGLRQARAGISVAATGDVNGDGRRDMIVGAPGAGRRCSPEEGDAYVVFSRPLPAPLDLGDLGEAGYAIRGELPDANAGVLVAGAGDWNRDGRGDALVLRADFDDSRRRQRPMLDLLLGRLPPPRPAAPSPAQLPRIVVPRPSLDRLLGGRGIDARVTVGESGPADAVLVEVFARGLGQELPIAFASATFSQPETATVKLVAPRIVRHFLRRRSRVRARVVLSQCTTGGHQRVARSRIVLRRATGAAALARPRSDR